MASVTTRAAARSAAAASAAATTAPPGAQTALLDMPDAVLERILIAASDGGRFSGLRSARHACRRLRAASKAAMRELSLRLCCLDDTLTQLALLPRLGGFTRLRLLLSYAAADYMGSYFGGDNVLLTMHVANSLYHRGIGLTDLWIRGETAGRVGNLARALGLLAGGQGGAVPPQEQPLPPPPPPPFLGGIAPVVLPRLTTLSLDWEGTLREPLAPLARLTRLTALELCGYAKHANKADWLPPNLEELHLGAHDERARNRLRGIGGAGWLAALHDGACPRLKALRLDKLAVRDVRPGGIRQGLTLESVLPRLTALEELVGVAYESTESEYYTLSGSDSDDDGSDLEGSMDWSDDDDDDGGDDDGGQLALQGVGGAGGGGGGGPQGGAFFDAEPFAAAPLLAALPNLRHCRLMFARFQWEVEFDRQLQIHCRTKPMLTATPAELSALRAPRLESLAVSLVVSRGDDILVCYCDDRAMAGENAAGVAAGSSVGSSVGSGLRALRSLELYAGCCRVDGGDDRPMWDLSSLAAGSLPALRRLLVLPRRFGCDSARLPLDAVARAAPGLERLVIEPRCAGPLDALFCDGGCARALRALLVLPPDRDSANALARIDVELRAGLRDRAAAARRAGRAAPRIQVTLFPSDLLSAQPGGGAKPPPARAYPRGAAVARRPLACGDGCYVERFLSGGLRPSSLPAGVFAASDAAWVEAYERRGA